MAARGGGGVIEIKKAPNNSSLNTFFQLAVCSKETDMADEAVATPDDGEISHSILFLNPLDMRSVPPSMLHHITATLLSCPARYR